MGFIIIYTKKFTAKNQSKKRRLGICAWNEPRVRHWVTARSVHGKSSASSFFILFIVEDGIIHRFHFVWPWAFNDAENAPGHVPRPSAWQQYPMGPHTPHLPAQPRFLPHFDQQFSTFKVRVWIRESLSKCFGTTQWYPVLPPRAVTIESEQWPRPSEWQQKPGDPLDRPQ